MTQASLIIRPMKDDEKKIVHRIMRQSFPLIQGWFFSWTPNVLVAEQDGQVLGATVLKLFSLPENRRGGLVYWVFTAPEARGLGLMMGVEFVKDKSTREPAPDLAAEVRCQCHRRGLLIEIGGHYNHVARFLPPLVLTQELALKGTEIFEDAVREVEKER